MVVSVIIFVLRVTVSHMSTRLMLALVELPGSVIFYEFPFACPHSFQDLHTVYFNTPALPLGRNASWASELVRTLSSQLLRVLTHTFL
jgi:hypothetical protein